MTEEGKLIFVVDTNNVVGISKQGNEIFGITPGMSNTAFGDGIFVNLVVGRRVLSQVEEEE